MEQTLKKKKNVRLKKVFFNHPLTHSVLLSTHIHPESISLIKYFILCISLYVWDRDGPRLSDAWLCVFLRLQNRFAHGRKSILQCVLFVCLSGRERELKNNKQWVMADHLLLWMSLMPPIPKWSKKHRTYIASKATQSKNNGTCEQGRERPGKRSVLGY